MEERIVALEKRIAELEEKLENVMIYSEGANVSFDNSDINILQTYFKFSVTKQMLHLKMRRSTVWKFPETETM